jgi:hypothetical protein
MQHMMRLLLMRPAALLMQARAGNESGCPEQKLARFSGRISGIPAA